jgi:L-amino acid N-acyltransferase YncA
MSDIRPFQPQDWPPVWSILQPVFTKGETYAYPIDITADEARYEWVEKADATFVVELEGELLGTYYIKTNQPGQGAHVCNCGYVVSGRARGKGLATAMCQHSQEEARSMGYRSMQYNLVAATNRGALSLWHKLGFETVGCLPGAFHSPTAGYVDAFILYKHLASD